MSGALPPLPQSIPAAKLLDWSRGPLVRRPCPVCRADAPELVCRRPDELEVHRCPACGMVYLARVPDGPALARFYADYAEWKGYQQRPAKVSWLALGLEALRDTHIRILEETGGLGGRRVLECGSSFGGFLERARWKGAQVTAVETDARARAHLEKRRIECFSTIPSGRTFDVVCAFQLLEHLADPGSAVAEMARALEPDGRLLIGVPNGGEESVVGPGWIGFRVDLEHLNYFGVRPLARLLADHRLLVEQFWLTAQPGIGRPNGAAGSRLGGLLSRFFESTRLVRAGSYVLTVLARRGA